MALPSRFTEQHEEGIDTAFDADFDSRSVRGFFEASDLFDLAGGRIHQLSLHIFNAQGD